jgi:agmatine deiminase
LWATFKPSSTVRSAGTNPQPPPRTPSALGYRSHRQVGPHEATWLSWPRRDGISFPDCYERVVPALCAMVHALGDSEQVNINVCDAEHEALVRAHLTKTRAKSSHVRFFHIPTNEPWCRDHGPIFITRAEAPRIAIVDWGYNAWGWKYPPFDDDDVVPTRIGRVLGLCL